jgi:hypothetical protein
MGVSFNQTNASCSAVKLFHSRIRMEDPAELTFESLFPDPQLFSDVMLDDCQSNWLQDLIEQSAKARRKRRRIVSSTGVNEHRAKRTRMFARLQNHREETLIRILKLPCDWFSVA